LCDIVVGDIDDVDQPQCHKCTKNTKKLSERERRKPISLITMSLKCYPLTGYKIVGLNV